MENYNLTAELKKIASGITSTDPNTELGNINSGVGNLDTAMQGVATAINGLSIPNPGGNIDGVATAIGNISIPNPGSNIDGVATAISNKIIPDPNTQLGNIANAINDLQSIIAGKFYREYLTYNSSGPWGTYHNSDVMWDIPLVNYGTGKTFMIVHNVRINAIYDCNIESYITLVNTPGTVYLDRFYFKTSQYLWTSFNHIAFISCDRTPYVRFGVSTNIAVNNVMSNFILVPLN